jgi:hypothetical protein
VEDGRANRHQGTERSRLGGDDEGRTGGRKESGMSNKQFTLFVYLLGIVMCGVSVFFWTKGDLFNQWLFAALAVALVIAGEFIRWRAAK